MWQPGRTLEDVEDEVIIKAYQFYRGNKTMTAQSLGIAVRTLDSKLEKLVPNYISANPVALKKDIKAKKSK